MHSRTTPPHPRVKPIPLHTPPHSTLTTPTRCAGKGKPIAPTPDVSEGEDDDNEGDDDDVVEDEEGSSEEEEEGAEAAGRAEEEDVDEAASQEESGEEEEGTAEEAEVAKALAVHNLTADQISKDHKWWLSRHTHKW